jgi:pentatricopeptide repeat protein
VWSHSTTTSLRDAGRRLSKCSQFPHLQIRCSSWDNTIPEQVRNLEMMAKRRAINSEIVQYINRGDVAGAEKLVFETDLSTIDFPIRLYNRLLAAYSDVGQILDFERLFDLLQNNPDMPIPDSTTYNLYLRIASVDGALSLLDQLVEQGIADTESFNTVISLCCKEDRIDEAITTLEGLIKYSKTNAYQKPDKISFSPLIRVAGEKGDPDLAELIFQQMRTYGIRPDLIAWTHLIYAWARSRRPDGPDRAMEILNAMDKEVPPDVEVYNVIMLAYASARDCGPEAEAILAQMPVDPTVVSFSTCINAWKNSPGLNDAVARAEAIFEAMHQHGHQPNDTVLSTLMHLYLSRSMPEKANAMLDKMAAPTVIDYNQMITAWHENIQKDSIVRGFQILKNMKVKPDHYIFDTMVNLIKKSPSERCKIDVFMELNGIMKEAGLKPDIRTYCSIFMMCSVAHGSRVAALKLTRRAFVEWQCRPEVKAARDPYIYKGLFMSLKANNASFEDMRMCFQRCCEDKAVCPEVIGVLEHCCNDRELQVLWEDDQKRM